MSYDVSTATVLQNKHVDTFEYDETVVQFARDCVKGSLKEYYFFQYDEDEYVLIQSDDCQYINNFHFSSFQSHVTVFYKEESTFTTRDDISLNGTISQIGATPNVSDVILTGTVSDSDIITTWKVYTFEAESTHIYDDANYMTYSSFGELPKLCESGDYYAYTGILLAACCIVFGIVDRIFSRVARVR